MDLLLILAAVVFAWLLFKPSPSSDTAAASAPSSNNPLDNITEAVARIEGYYQNGSLAQRTNNPGNIGTYGGKVASYADAGNGWDALMLWVQTHAQQNPNWDFYDMFHYYLTGDTLSNGGPGQTPDQYAEYVANYVGVDPTTPVSSVLG